MGCTAEVMARDVTARAWRSRCRGAGAGLLLAALGTHSSAALPPAVIPPAAQSGTIVADDSYVEHLHVATGDVTRESAVLLASTANLGAVEFVWAAESGTAQSATLTVSDPLVPARLEISGLNAATAYEYSATDAAGRVAHGRFTTPAPTGQRRGLRFGVSGDWRGELSPYPSVSNVAARELDVFVALGDTIYADVASPLVPKPQCETLADFRQKHAEVYDERFGIGSLAAARASTAWLATIDDHEVTNDFSGGAAPADDPRFDPYGEFINDSALYANGLQAFHEHHPIREEFYPETGDPRTSGKRKLYRRAEYGDDAVLLVLDARSFRDAPIAAGLGDIFAPARWQRAVAAPGRTMLGQAQFDELTRDLLRAHYDGVTWKFVLVPEPIQNLGPVAGEDRFEGYADERSRLLRFIDEHGIANVVFVTADIHCTIVNNLTYALEAGGPQVATGTWEISTGSVAYAAPFGPTLVQYVSAIPVFGPLFALLHECRDRDGKDRLIIDAMNALLDRWGYDSIGLEGSGIPFELLTGQWASLHTYGWSEFEIDAATQRLTVTTYGIDWYDADELNADPSEVVGRVPQIVQQFAVDATPVQPLLLGDLNGDGLVNAADVDPFLLALTDPAGYATAFPKCRRQAADLSCDGSVDGLDVEPFIALTR
ncbi:MAG: hypothetical protein CHACPFDD_00165 [Phycisphaerae bacterium]|nr:hypothetical protein [Phycisphaerae bacterium]